MSYKNLTDTLRSRFCGDSAPGPEDLEALKDEEKVVHSENEEKVWSFLQTRASLLLKAYPCTLEVCQILLFHIATQIGTFIVYLLV